METLQSEIHAQLGERFPGNTFLRVGVVEGNCGAGVTVWLCCPSFEGLSLLQQHRLLQKELERYGARIHKTTLKTMSPQAFLKKQAKGLLPA